MCLNPKLGFVSLLVVVTNSEQEKNILNIKKNVAQLD